MDLRLVLVLLIVAISEVTVVESRYDSSPENCMIKVRVNGTQPYYYADDTSGFVGPPSWNGTDFPWDVVIRQGILVVGSPTVNVAAAVGTRFSGQGMLGTLDLNNIALGTTVYMSMNYATFTGWSGLGQDWSAPGFALYMQNATTVISGLTPTVIPVEAIRQGFPSTIPALSGISRAWNIDMDEENAPGWVSIASGFGTGYLWNLNNASERFSFTHECVYTTGDCTGYDKDNTSLVVLFDTEARTVKTTKLLAEPLGGKNWGHDVDLSKKYLIVSNSENHTLWVYTLLDVAPDRFNYSAKMTVDFTADASFNTGVGHRVQFLHDPEDMFLASALGLGAQTFLKVNTNGSESWRPTQGIGPYEGEDDNMGWAIDVSDEHYLVSQTFPVNQIHVIPRTYVTNATFVEYNDTRGYAHVEFTFFGDFEYLYNTFEAVLLSNTHYTLENISLTSISQSGLDGTGGALTEDQKVDRLQFSVNMRHAAYEADFYLVELRQTKEGHYVKLPYCDNAPGLIYNYTFYSYPKCPQDLDPSSHNCTVPQTQVPEVNGCGWKLIDLETCYWSYYGGVNVSQGEVVSTQGDITILGNASIVNGGISIGGDSQGGMVVKGGLSLQGNVTIVLSGRSGNATAFSWFTLNNESLTNFNIVTDQPLKDCEKLTYSTEYRETSLGVVFSIDETECTKIYIGVGVSVGVVVLVLIAFVLVVSFSPVARQKLFPYRYREDNSNLRLKTGGDDKNAQEMDTYKGN